VNIAQDVVNSVVADARAFEQVDPWEEVGQAVSVVGLSKFGAQQESHAAEALASSRKERVVDLRHERGTSPRDVLDHDAVWRDCPSHRTTHPHLPQFGNPDRRENLRQACKEAPMCLIVLQTV
jgi:hypothetical protein